MGKSSTRTREQGHLFLLVVTPTDLEGGRRESVALFLLLPQLPPGGGCASRSDAQSTTRNLSWSSAAAASWLVRTAVQCAINNAQFFPGAAARNQEEGALLRSAQSSGAHRTTCHGTKVHASSHFVPRLSHLGPRTKIHHPIRGAWPR